MIDKTLKKYPLYFYKTDTKNYPRYELPRGYRIEFYKKGDERFWAELEVSLGQFDSVEAGISAFERSFINGQDLKAEERVAFVKDELGEYVATCALWDGEYLGEKCQRLHWLAVSDKCAGKGIAKALISALLDLYNSLGYDGFIYLLTGTWYYKAIGIYRKFGFTEYCGERSLIDGMSDSEFSVQNREAIAIVNNKLNEYEGKNKNEKRN